MFPSVAIRSFAGMTLFVLFLATPVFVQAQASPQAEGCQVMLDRWRQAAAIPITEWRAQPVRDFRGEVPELDDSSWEVVKPSKQWDAGSVWLRRLVEIPASRNGYDLRGSRLELRLDIGGDYEVPVIAYVDGVRRAEGYVHDPIVVAESAEPGRTILIALKAQVPAGKLRLGNMQLEVFTPPGRPDPGMLLEECLSAEAINETAQSGKAERAQIIERASKTIDWAALERGDQGRFDESLKQAHAILEPLREWLRGHSIHAVGNAHIDIAWLWPWTETVEVTRDTFSSVLNLMQDYPDFTFTHASAQTYAWMEDKYPSLFEAIRQRVREGRWEIVGGMWVEPDLNLPDGESLVRNIVVGKRYFKEKFGVDVRVGWNPDSFGYNWQLPQIYKKAGMDFFVTQKIGWNDTTKFPHKLFWWEAPDGSRVLTYFPHDYVNTTDPVRMARDLATYAPATGVPRLMHLYGIGDHGGGPTRRMLETARRWQAPAAVYPRLTFSTAQGFFDQVTPKLDSLNVPVWKDELYLEYHRGTYTTQAKTKKNNRSNEALILNAEKFSSLAMLYGEHYHRKDFGELWQKLLFNQFHDILPGSSIAPVYRDATRDHAEIRRRGGEILGRALAAITARVRTEGPGVPVVVFNPLSWARTDAVEADVTFPMPVTDVEVHGADGARVIAAVLARDAETRSFRVRFLAEAVPSLGYKTFHVVPVQQLLRPASSLIAKADALENEFLRVRVDPQSGCITSLFDKRERREALAQGACGNLLQAFRDKPRDWDAWNIDADFENEKWELMEAEEVKLVENTPVRATIRVTKKFRGSKFVQDIMLYPRIARVDVRMEADWREDHTLLKVAFPVAVRSDVAAYEIPYGSIERPTTRRTPAEKAKFEVPALRWADISDGSYGFSLLNDGKYGHDARDNVLRLSLLRSPKWPDPDADRGVHEFTYSLYPHVGTWREAGTVRRGYELNYRLIPFVATSHQGSLAPVHSFVELAPANVVLTAIKEAEDGTGLIFRFYEYAGRETQVRLRLPAVATRALATNLLEQEARELRLQGGEVVVPTRPYEVKAVKIQFSPESKK